LPLSPTQIARQWCEAFPVWVGSSSSLQCRRRRRTSVPMPPSRRPADDGAVMPPAFVVLINGRLTGAQNTAEGDVLNVKGHVLSFLA